MLLEKLSDPESAPSIAYDGEVAMTPFGRLLNDDELTYVHNRFGNTQVPIVLADMKKVRDADLGSGMLENSINRLNEHPHKIFASN
jgi:hypothetical protein